MSEIPEVKTHLGFRPDFLNHRNDPSDSEPYAVLALDSGPFGEVLYDIISEHIDVEG
jgi:hypothetical protein